MNLASQPYTQESFREFPEQHPDKNHELIIGFIMIYLLQHNIAYISYERAPVFPKKFEFAEDRLDGGTALPGFSVKVGAIFPERPQE